jgi:hypothetical protein
MRRSSPYHVLKYVVRCRWPQNTWFEPIAAFNSEGIARDYAQEARNRSKRQLIDLNYDVCERDGRGKLISLFAPE